MALPSTRICEQQGCRCDQREQLSVLQPLESLLITIWLLQRKQFNIYTAEVFNIFQTNKITS